MGVSPGDHDRLTHGLEAFVRDVQGAIGESFELQVIEAASEVVLFGPRLSAEQVQDVAAFGHVGLVARTGAHYWAVRVEEGVDVNGGVDDVIVQIATTVQDDVMDELGRGWPEAQRDGRFVALLTPRVVDRQVVWSDESGDFVIPLGSLRLRLS